MLYSSLPDSTLISLDEIRGKVCGYIFSVKASIVLHVSTLKYE